MPILTSFGDDIIFEQVSLKFTYTNYIHFYQFYFGQKNSEVVEGFEIQ